MRHRNPNLLEDRHVHSTFSDGRDSVRDNLAQAAQLGLQRFTCVDHVNAYSSYLPAFVAEIARVRSETDIEVFTGVEAKILNEAGQLDIPAQLQGIDYIYAADHQVPLGDSCYKPIEIRRQIAQGILGRQQVVSALIDATIGVLCQYPRVVLAHLFSVLPKVGIDENAVPLSQLQTLAAAAHEFGASVEIDERWGCPGPRTIRVFHQAEVPILLSTDSHSKDTIGVYQYARTVLQEVLQ